MGTGIWRKLLENFVLSVIHYVVCFCFFVSRKQIPERQKIRQCRIIIILVLVYRLIIIIWLPTAVTKHWYTVENNSWNQSLNLVHWQWWQVTSINCFWRYWTELDFCIFSVSNSHAFGSKSSYFRQIWSIFLHSQYLWC